MAEILALKISTNNEIQDFKNDNMEQEIKKTYNVQTI